MKIIILDNTKLQFKNCLYHICTNYSMTMLILEYMICNLKNINN